MTVSSGDILKVIAEFVLTDGSIAQNIFYYVLTAIVDQTDADVKSAIVGQIDDIYDEVASQINSGVTDNPLQVVEIAFNATTSTWEVVRDLGFESQIFNPSNIGDPFPNQIAAVMTAPTARPKTRGRKFIPGFTDTTADASTLSTGALAALASAAVEYIQTIVMDVNTFLTPGVPRDGVNDFRSFSSAEANSIVGTQRRRKPGVGV